MTAFLLSLALAARMQLAFSATIVSSQELTITDDDGQIVAEWRVFNVPDPQHAVAVLTLDGCRWTGAGTVLVSVEPNRIDISAPVALARGP